MDACPFGPGSIMGETNMFDLNECIKKWRVGLAQSQSLGKKDIDELEGHLREEIDHLKESKLSDEEAFLVATHRLGDSVCIAEEYAKIDYGHIFRRRFFWAVVGVLVYLLLTYSATAVEKICILIGGMGGVSVIGLWLIGLVSRVAIVITVFYFCCRIYRQNSNNCKLIGANRFVRYGNLMIAIFIILFAIAINRIIFPIMASRILDIRDYGLVATSSSFAKLLWSIFLPVLLVVLLKKLHKPDDLYEVGT